jgi:uncharacterized iron-regulated membrane protein
MNTVASASKYRLPSARKIWLNIHLWFGLTAGFALAVLGLTGSLLVINGPILKMQFGEIFDVEGPPPQVFNVDAWIANARRSYGDIQAVPFVVGPGFGPTRGNAAVLGADVTGKKRSLVTVNPNTGLPLGKYLYEDAYASFITTLHARLLASGPWLGFARTALAWLGVAMVMSMATGLYLWWPRNRNWYIAFTLKRGARGRRRLLDLHNLFSVYLYVPLLLIALTGIYFARPDWIDPAVSQVSIAREPEPAALARASRPGSCQTQTTASQAVALALARFPSSKFVLMTIPQSQAEPYYVQLAPPNNIGPKGQTQVWVDQACPTILTSIDGATRTAAETFQAAMHPLHGELMLGRFGQVIVFLTGLLLPLSFVTGWLLWLNGRKTRPASS